MPYCSHCGAKIEYCPICGQPLTATAEAARPAAAAPMEEVYEERVLWEGKPGPKAGGKALTVSYRVSSERVQVIHSGLSKKIEEVELARLKDVKVQQSLTQRALKTGNVTVLSTDPSAPTLVLEEISEPESVKELIRTAAREELERLKVRRFAEQ